MTSFDASMRTLETMNSTGNSDIEQVLAALLTNRAQSSSQHIDPTVAAVITAEHDLRFLPDTIRAVLSQRVLPGIIVVVDCSGSKSQPVFTHVAITPSADSHTASSQPHNIEIRVIPVQGATSFSNAVCTGMSRAALPATISAWWMLHDDSRPADDTCLARLLDAWRNNPAASLLGCKQLDWQDNNLHNVGMYAGHHRLESLVVDGEEDQEQYDTRQDVFAVSLAGALLPVETLHTMDGINRWFTTYGESADFCRRICLDGGRVVVVPEARIAHRRARYEGIRTRNGEPVDEQEPLHSAMAVMSAAQRYLYTDIPTLLWPLLWLWRLLTSIGKALEQLFAKRPYKAGCELGLPWRALIAIPSAIKARRLVVAHSNVPMSRLSALSVSRQQKAQWKDRAQALEDQQHTILLNPLARAHLRRRRIRRWGLALSAALIAFLAIAISYRTTLTAAFSDSASIYSAQLLPTSATFHQLTQAATTPWIFGAGTGIPAPPTPWLLVWLVTSLFTLGQPAAALALIFFAAAPLATLSFWALAGVFTRSDGVRVTASLLWVGLGMATGLFATANLPMLTVLMFMPAAFAFAFRAVAMYRTEDQLHPHRSIQSAALASLCFIPVVAAEPQLLLPLIATFLIFLLFVRRHRVMLLLIPVPSAFVIAPTLVNTIKYGSEGVWRQIFGDIMIPSSSVDGRPAAAHLLGVIGRALSLDNDDAWTMRLSGNWPALALLVVLALIVVLALVSLCLPFALRASRLMWVTSLAGGLLALCCARIAIAADADGDVAASVLPGFMMMILGLLSCVCLVAGAAVKRFTLLRQSADCIDSAHDTAAGLRAERVAARVAARTAMARTGRVMLVAVLTLSVSVCGWYAWSASARRSVNVSNTGLPMVATDYLAQGSDHRVLALHASSDDTVEFTVLRSGRGDLIDSSPVRRLRLALDTNSSSDTSTHSDVDATDATDTTDAILSRSAARLLAGADAQSIIDISQLGFGGIFVSVAPSDNDNSAAQRLISNVTASEGTQTVVSAANGTYYRLTISSADSQNIDTSWQERTQSSQWRYAWLICAGIIVALYCLVALPHGTTRYSQGEES